jgi:signal transduction histidine kinase
VENGFRSVALVPLRYRGEVLGLIHLADEREGWVPESTVSFVESMAPVMSEAIHRFTVEEDLERAYRSQLLLDELLKAALEDLTSEAFLQRAMDLLEAHPPPGFRAACGIFLSVGGVEKMILQAHRGLSETFLRCPSVSRTECLCCRTAASGEVNCTEKDDPCEAAREEGGICSVPLRSSRGVTGVLLLGLRVGERVDSVKQEFLKTLADVIASAMEHKRAEEALRNSENRCRYLSSELLVAQESERRAIAQDVHDSLGATLAAAKIQLENTKSIKGKGAARAMAARMDDLLPLLRQTMEEVRRIQMALRPAMLDDLGLVPTMRWFCDQFQKSYEGIRLARDIGVEETDVPDHLQIVIFRILQEALNNVSKHSRADKVEVGLRKRDGCLELSVGDNGMGFEWAAIASQRDQRRGLGLTSMRERAELSGGIFALESAPGKGTWVRASWPLPGDDGSLR